MIKFVSEMDLSSLLELIACGLVVACAVVTWIIFSK